MVLWRNPNALWLLFSIVEYFDYMAREVVSVDILSNLSSVFTTSGWLSNWKREWLDRGMYHLPSYA